MSSSELNVWLKKETSNRLSPLESKAKNLVSDLKKQLESLTEFCNALLVKTGYKIEHSRKISGKTQALNKLVEFFLDRLNIIKLSDQFDYNELSEFIQKSEQAYVATEIDIQRWFPRISPSFFFDRRKFMALFEKVKIVFRDLAEFATKEYSMTKDYFEIFQN